MVQQLTFRWAPLAIVVVGVIGTEITIHLATFQRLTKAETLLDIVRSEQLLVQKQLREGCRK